MRSESHWGQEPTALLLNPLAHLLSPVAILPLQNTLYFSISKTLKFSNHHDILFLLILLVTNDSNIVLYIFKFSIMSHKRIKTFWFIITCIASLLSALIAFTNAYHILTFVQLIKPIISYLSVKNSMVKKIETIKPAKNIVFIDKHLQKYQTRDILMTERNTLRYKRKTLDNAKYIR